MQSKALDKSVSTAPPTKSLSKSFLHSSIRLIKMFCELQFFLYADKNGENYSFHAADYLVFDNSFVNLRKCVQYTHWSKI